MAPPRREGVEPNTAIQMDIHTISREALEALNTAKQRGLAKDHHGALTFAKHAIELNARVPAAPLLYASALRALGRPAEAYAVVRDAIAVFPDEPTLFGLYETLAVELPDLLVARELLERKVTHDHTDADAWTRLSGIYYELGDLFQAEKAAKNAIQLAHNNPNAWSNLGTVLRHIGDPSESISCYRKALACDPNHLVSRTNLLFTLLSDANISGRELLIEAKKAADAIATTINIEPAHFRSRSEKIRVGLISADIRRHAVSYFLIPLLANLDHHRYDVILFRLNRSSDNVTAKIEKYVNEVHDVSGRLHHDIVSKLNGCSLDVLIELGGYTGISPLQYLKGRVAPVQVTWLGYPGSTGMNSIDYRISDLAGDPLDFDDYYSETLLRGPAFCVYHPHAIEPLKLFDSKYRVRPTPALENGYITFGSCSSIAKLSTTTLNLWASVLSHAKNSRLLIETNGVEDPGVHDSLMLRISAAGIDTSRVTLIPREICKQYLTYHQIDIVLDTAPFTGGTTTCDALWMGVPVVTLTGPAFHRRISASVLASAGLDALSCDSEQAYIETAAALAADVPALDQLRQTIRQRFEQGPMSNARAFTRWLEGTLDQILAGHRPIPEKETPPENALFFNGSRHTVQELMLSLATLLDEGDAQQARRLMEWMTNAWHRHWVVAYGLAKLEYVGGSHDEAIALLIEAIGMKPYSVPLYRLLGEWMKSCGYDRTALEQHLSTEFGLQLAYLDTTPVPSSFEVMGFDVVQEAA